MRRPQDGRIVIELCLDGEGTGLLLTSDLWATDLERRPNKLGVHIDRIMRPAPVSWAGDEDGKAEDWLWRERQGLLDIKNRLSPKAPERVSFVQVLVY